MSFTNKEIVDHINMVIAFYKHSNSNNKEIQSLQNLTLDDVYDVDIDQVCQDNPCEEGEYYDVAQISSLVYDNISDYLDHGNEYFAKCTFHTLNDLLYDIGFGESIIEYIDFIGAFQHPPIACIFE